MDKYKELLNYFNPHKNFLNGNEPFTFHGKALPNTVKDYWSWSFSDIYNNIYRGILAEYIVATAIGITPPDGDFIRTVWNPFDLLSKNGKRIEVKSAAYLQSWDGGLSKINFRIAPARVYDHSLSNFEPSLQRNSDIYVFCVNIAKTRDISPLNLDYWDFYVLPTSTLNEKKPTQKSISLNTLVKLHPAYVKYDELHNAIMKFT